MKIIDCLSMDKSYQMSSMLLPHGDALKQKTPEVIFDLKARQDLRSVHDRRRRLCVRRYIEAGTAARGGQRDNNRHPEDEAELPPWNRGAGRTAGTRQPMPVMIGGNHGNRGFAHPTINYRLLRSTCPEQIWYCDLFIRRRYLPASLNLVRNIRMRRLRACCDRAIGWAFRSVSVLQRAGVCSTTSAEC